MKVIFFDIGGVYAKGTLSHQIQILSDSLNINKEIVESVVKEFIKDFSIGKMSETDFFKKVSSKLKVKPGAVRALWASEIIFKVDKDVKNIVKELKENGYVVGTITDIDPVQKKEHLRRGTYKVFDIVVTSVDARSTKTGKLIYKKALQLAGANPQDCIMIDDNENKLVAAKELGMNTIFFKNSIQLEKDLRSLGVKI
ncbi:HAD-IA family hydrolase [Candidatus Woesearchaeota archaeon]|nr:HAD-IA family hydrolase [Candidatus Woesearchaeota archaeon]